MKKINFPTTLLYLILSILFLACKKDTNTSAPVLIKEWSVLLSPKNQNPARTGRVETGTVALKLYSNNSLKYTINVTNLAPDDVLTAAHIHAGDVITNGPVVLGFDPVFSGSTATATISNLRMTFTDSLKDDINELYFNIHSTQQPGGLLRGQLNAGIEMAEDVVLLGTNELTPVTTTANGLAILRLTDKKKLYSKITVANLELDDTLSAAHIHLGASGVNGAVIVGLCGSAADFGVAKQFALSDAIYANVKSDAVYVNAHSTKHPGGIIRGQIR